MWKPQARSFFKSYLGLDTGARIPAWMDELRIKPSSCALVMKKWVSLQLLCDFLWCCCLGARRRCTNLHVQECSVVDAGIVR